MNYEMAYEAHQQGYYDALEGKPASKFVKGDKSKSDYLAGYRQGTHERSLDAENDKRCQENLRKQPAFAQKHVNAIKKQSATMPAAILAMLQ
jgi:hypothetical protein